jgi:flagellar biosynthesis/type III secretory pathway chaperone
MTDHPSVVHLEDERISHRQAQDRQIQDIALEKLEIVTAIEDLTDEQIAEMVEFAEGRDDSDLSNSRLDHISDLLDRMLARVIDIDKRLKYIELNAGGSPKAF